MLNAGMLGILEQWAYIAQTPPPRLGAEASRMGPSGGSASDLLFSYGGSVCSGRWGGGADGVFARALLGHRPGGLRAPSDAAWRA